jgi:hypothetical protein
LIYFRLIQASGCMLRHTVDCYPLNEHNCSSGRRVQHMEEELFSV